MFVVIAVAILLVALYLARNYILLFAMVLFPESLNRIGSVYGWMRRALDNHPVAVVVLMTVVGFILGTAF